MESPTIRKFVSSNIVYDVIPLERDILSLSKDESPTNIIFYGTQIKLDAYLISEKFNPITWLE